MAMVEFAGVTARDITDAAVIAVTPEIPPNAAEIVV
jgi:hypothetical protein